MVVRLDFEVFAEAVIEQMNSLRMQKVNLVQDMDDIVNDYSCKYAKISHQSKKVKVNNGSL